MEQIFFSGWASIFRTAIITIMGYILLIILLRSSGKRTLSKMNAFDLIVTIALGSTLATVMLNKNVALADGVLAFFLLIYLQYIITFLASRHQWISDLVKSKPTMLVFRGKLFKDLMRRERIDEDEIYAVIRQKGLGSLADAGAVILETDGTLTVVTQVSLHENDVLKNVQKPEPLQQQDN